MHPMHGITLINHIQKHGLTIIQGKDQKTWYVLSRYIEPTEEQIRTKTVPKRLTTTSENLSEAILALVMKLTVDTIGTGELCSS